jgi:hypothetical protein
MILKKDWFAAVAKSHYRSCLNRLAVPGENASHDSLAGAIETLELPLSLQNR